MRTHWNTCCGVVATAGVLGLFTLTACADSGGGSGDEQSSNSVGDGDGDGDGDSNGDGDGDGDGDTNGDGDGDGDGDDGGNEAPKFDVLALPDGDQSCDQNCGNTTGYSYIWIANSNESTVTKLNTETLVEEGRYRTRADGSGSPSRTSVSIDGMIGSVNNRSGGVMSIWSRPEFCDPNKNGMPGVQTSEGANDVLAWEEDDCVVWYRDDMNNHTTQRPIAWTAGDYNEATCQFEDQKLWTSGCQSGVHTNIQAFLLNREDGSTAEQVDVTGFQCSGFGGYGGAADGDGSFYITNLGTTLARVNADDLSVEIFTIPNSVYGLTVDSQNRPWMASNMGNGGTSAVMFDPETEQFTQATGGIASAQTGIAEDGEGRMWMNYWSYDGGNGRGIAYIDMETFETSPPYQIVENSSSSKGISVDFEGYIWSASFSNQAFKVDVENMTVQSYDNLNYPYTYSDMTGGALTGVACGSPVG